MVVRCVIGPCKYAIEARRRRILPLDFSLIISPSDRMF